MVIIYWATFGAALGCGLIAGVFFAFSVFVMSALARLPAAQGIAAMQSINITVINPWFMSAFVGTALVCAALVVASFIPSLVSRPGLLISASLFYLIGTILVTGMANVPRNDALASLAPESADAAQVWENYLTAWTHWNHVRTLSSLLASALFTTALSLFSKP